MTKVLILLRFTLLCVLFTLPGSILGLVFYGPRGALCGFTANLILVLGVAMRAEDGVAKAHRAHSQLPLGLHAELVNAARGQTQSLPRLMIFADPVPNAFAVRSLGGRGTIFVSQGVVSCSKEKELRDLLRQCVTKVEGSDTVFQSFCSIWVIWLMSIAPRNWVRFAFEDRILPSRDEKRLRPLSFLGFLMVVQVARFLLSFAKLNFEPKNSTFLRCLFIFPDRGKS